MDAFTEHGNMSSVLNVSSYSLANASNTTGDSVLFEDDEELVLDRSVLDLMDHPYTQRHGARLSLRKDEQCEGFDNTVGHSWIYPINYPIRQYQYAISKAALFKNTLVVLPTGLGKTFIAAVVMYNIYRWYPRGKVIFMAPTRPLVSQQIDACYRVMGIPRSDTCELTGKTQRHRRSALWQTKRVFYATPQVVLADLCAPDHPFPTDQVRLVVIDEAHKAKGRYAYTELVRRIAEGNGNFRVLALSATPGRTLEDVAEVVKNLLIAHIEVRWENSIDVQQYTFRRDMRTIVIPLGETILRIRHQLLDLIDPYLRRLLNENLVSGCPRTLTRGILILEQNRYRANAMHQRHPDHTAIMGDFSVCVSLYHALELLVRYGVHTFLNFFDNCGQEKYYVATDRQIKAFINALREEFRAARENHHQPQANDVAEYGHPKYRILERELVDFFRKCPESRVIVFCEFRDSVATINRLLANNQPLIRPKCIVGQGGTTVLRAVTQHEQIATMRAFRNGSCNTLIATCVVEEGIDVGEVDLIVCFDIAKNPSRFVQRIGRTARQRVGRVLMLVTEGEEHATFKKVMATKNRTNQQLARSPHILNVLYRHSPRLVPAAFEPKCVEMFINVPKEEKPAAEGQEEEDGKENESGGTGHKKRKKKRNTPSESDSDDSMQEQPAKRKKCDTEGLRDVRELFQRQPATSSPLNRTGGFQLQPARTQAETTRERIVQQLVRHREQLHRQKFLYRQQLLTVPTRDQLLNRATLKQILVRSLIGPSKRLTVDDPLELPVSGWIERKATPPPDPPTQVEASIVDMFDESGTLPFLPEPSPNEVPVVAPVRRDIREVLKDRTPLATGSKSRLAALKTSAHRSTPIDPRNSPLLLAFNRSVCKQRNSNEQAGTTPVAERRRESLHRQMVLEYFLLRRVEDIFCDESPVPSSQGTPPVGGTHGTARKLLFEPVAEPIRQCKNIDLGSASQVFEFDSDSEGRLTPPTLLSDTERVLPAVTRYRTPAKSKMFERLLTAPVRQPSPALPPPTNQCPPDRSKYCFVRQTCASPVRAVDESIIGAGQARRTVHHRTPTKSKIFERLLTAPVRQPSPALPPPTDQCPPDLSKYFFVRKTCASPVRAVDESIIGAGQARRAVRNRLDSLEEATSGSQEDDDFVKSWKSKKPQAHPATPQSPAPKRRKQAAKRRPKAPAMRAFFQSQATVSDDDTGDESEEDDPQADESLLRFVAADSEEEEEEAAETSAVDMRAAYLQSVRSPVVRRHGGFKIPALPAMNRPTSFLEAEDNDDDDDDDEYNAEMASFITDEIVMVETQLTELERAEQVLRQRRRNGRRKVPDDKPSRKRHRRIQHISSDSE